MTSFPKHWEKDVRTYARDMEKRGWRITATKRGHAIARHPSGATVGIAGGNDPSRNFANLKAAVRRIENQHDPREREPEVSTAPVREVVSKRPALAALGRPRADGRVLARESPCVERWTWSDGTHSLHCRACGEQWGSLKLATTHYARHARAGEVPRSDRAKRPILGPFDPSEVETATPRKPRAPKAPKPLKLAKPAPTPLEDALAASDAEATLALVRELVAGPAVEELTKAKARIAELEAALGALADLAKGSL